MMVQFNSEKEWLEARYNVLTASDMPSILGVQSFKSASQVATSKITRQESRETKDNLLLEWGRIMEDIVMRKFELHSNTKVVAHKYSLTYYDNNPLIAASLDGISEDGDFVVECKSPSGFGSRSYSELDAPKRNFIQTQVQMMCAGVDKGYIAAYVNPNVVTEESITALKTLILDYSTDEIIDKLDKAGFKFFVYCVAIDDQTIDMFNNAANNFWETKVIKSNNNDSYPQPDEIVATSPVEVDSVDVILFKELRRLRKESDVLDERIKEIESAIKLKYNAADVVTNNGQVMWTYRYVAPSLKFDVDTFKEAHYDLYSQYLSMSKTTRRFIINKKYDSLNE